MFAYIVRRLVYGVVTLFALSIIVFLLLQAAGGGPLDRLKLNPRMTQEFIQDVTEFYGLDRPLWQQYATWLGNFVRPTTFAVQGALLWVGLAVAAIYSALYFSVIKLKNWATTGLLIVTWLFLAYSFVRGVDIAFDWGISFQGTQPVWGLIGSRVGATFRLGVAALTIALMVGIPFGIYQALRQYSFFDQLGTTMSFIAFSTPVFILGVGLQLLLALYLERWTGVKLFYVAGMNSANYGNLGFFARMGDVWSHLALPAITIALLSIAQYSRFQRASMLEVMHSDYLRTAKAKGLPRRRIITKHALRNALIPIVTLVSLDVAAIVGGAVITETIFGWPGIGRLYITAINTIDYPVVMAVVMAIGSGIVVMNIIADIVYGVLDPRVRYD